MPSFKQAALTAAMLTLAFHVPTASAAGNGHVGAPSSSSSGSGSSTSSSSSGDVIGAGGSSNVYPNPEFRFALPALAMLGGLIAWLRRRK